MIYLFADLEAYSTSYYKKHGKVKEYIVGCKDLDDTFMVEDVTIDGWLDQLKDLKTTSTIFFHNLSGYDGQFLINPIINKFGKGNVKYFMDEKKKLFEITATFRYRDYDDLNEKGQPKRKKVKLSFRDSWKIWPLSVKSMGKALGLEKLDYGEYDILDTFETIDDYKEHNDGISYEYFVRDIEIVRRFAKLTNDIMPLKDYKLTMASTAMETWRKSNLQYEKIIKWSMMRKEEKGNEVNWNACYDDWYDVKAAYKGGITWVKPEHQLRLLTGLWVYDINSMYPGIMLNSKLPYGTAERNEAKLTEAHTYKIYKVNIKKAKTETMPFIAKSNSDDDKNVVEIMKMFSKGQNNNITDQDKYPTELKDEEVYMNNYTYELFESTYEGEWTKEFVLAYKEKYGQFNEYISKFKAIKEVSKGAIRELAKLFLNSLYGKFGQDIKDLSSEILFMEDIKDDIVYTEKTAWYDNERIIINGDVAYIKRDNGLKRNISYIAMAEAITAKARVQLVKAINANWDIFVYCDTDSIHLLGPAKDIELHATEFGKWAFEGCWNEGIYRRPKHYAHYGLKIDEDFNEVNDDNAFELKGGGFNVNAFQTKEDMPKELYIKETFTVEGGKTNSYIVDGGVLIMDADYNFTMPSTYKGQDNDKKRI